MRRAATLLVSVLFASGCESSLNLGNPDGGDAQVATTCPSACDKVIACGYVEAKDRAACVSKCESTSSVADLDCVGRSTCQEMPSACAGAAGQALDGGVNGFAVFDCQQSCGTALFFKCVSASEHAACRSLCETSTSSKRDTFTSCANGAGTDCAKERDCYAEFGR